MDHYDILDDSPNQPGDPGAEYQDYLSTLMGDVDHDGWSEIVPRDEDDQHDV